MESITWNISVHNPFYINITLTRINLTDSVEGCRVESIQLVWGEGLRSHRICGVRLPYNKHLDKHTVNVHYTTEGGPRQGLFSVYYQVLPRNSKLLTRTFYMNLEEDSHGLETDEINDWNVNDYMYDYRYNYIDFTMVFANLFRQSSHEFELTLRVLPSFVIVLLVVKANATVTSDILGLRCHDGPETIYRTLAVSKQRNWERVTKFTAGTVLESTGFVMTCRLALVYRSCDQCKDIKMYHMRFPNNNIRTIDVKDFSITRLPDSQYCSSHLCLLNLTTSSGTSVKYTLTHLTLPNIDHSRDCLYEGVAIYEGKKHDSFVLDQYSNLAARVPDQLNPIVRICSRVRQAIGTETKEDYLVYTVVSTGNSLIVAFYAFHPSLSMGQLHFTTDVSLCQGFYAFCGQVTTAITDSSTCKEAVGCHSTYDQLGFNRYYRDIYMEPYSKLEIPVLERDAYMGVTTNASHTYNVVAVRPKSCAVIQYFPRKVYPTGRARECTISMIRARDTGSGELNITVDHLSEYSKQCTHVPSLEIHKDWTLLVGSDASQAYMLNDVVPHCSRISTLVTQYKTSSSDILQTAATVVTMQYIGNTFFVPRSKLHKYVHSLNHSLQINASNRSSYEGKQFGIGHVKSLENLHSRPMFFLEGQQQLQPAFMFWTEFCTVRLSIAFIYQLSALASTSKLYCLQFTTSLHRRTNVTFSQPYFYFRRFLILRILNVTTSTPEICKVRLNIDIRRQFGVLNIDEEHSWTDTEAFLPVQASQMTHVYVAWGYTNLTWNEANTNCSAMGGYLPSVTTKEELDFLEKAVYGKFTPAQLVIHPCRALSVVCSFFMGLNTRLVSLRLANYCVSRFLLVQP